MALGSVPFPAKQVVGRAGERDIGRALFLEGRQREGRRRVERGRDGHGAGGGDEAHVDVGHAFRINVLRQPGDVEVAHPNRHVAGEEYPRAGSHFRARGEGELAPTGRLDDLLVLEGAVESKTKLLLAAAEDDGTSPGDGYRTARRRSVFGHHGGERERCSKRDSCRTSAQCLSPRPAAVQPRADTAYEVDEGAVERFFACWDRADKPETSWRPRPHPGVAYGAPERGGGPRGGSLSVG